MKKIWLLACGSLFLGGFAGIIGLNVITQEGPEPAISERFAPGEALVQMFTETVPEEEIKQRISHAGANIKERIDPHKIYVVTFSEAIPPREMVARLKQIPGVDVAEPNGLYEPLALEFDPLAPAEALAAPPQREPSASLGAGARTVVANLDTAAHAAADQRLAGRVVSAYNFPENEMSVYYHSWGGGQNYHGTMVMGQIYEGCRWNPHVYLMPLQVFREGREKEGARCSDMIKAITYATNGGAHIINVPLGGYFSSPPKLLQKAVDYASQKGVMVVAAAGNNKGRILYPAACQGVLCVGAVDPLGRVSRFSNYGQRMELCAPGSRLRVLYAGGGYRVASGTSLAASFVAGNLAMLKSAYPRLTSDQLKQILKARAIKFYPLVPFHERIRHWAREGWHPVLKRWALKAICACFPRYRYYHAGLGVGYITPAVVSHCAYQISHEKFRLPEEKRKMSWKDPKKVDRPEPLFKGPSERPKPVPQPYLVRGNQPRSSGNYLAISPGSGALIELPQEQVEKEEELKKKKEQTL